MSIILAVGATQTQHAARLSNDLNAYNWISPQVAGSNPAGDAI